jgi:phosphoribosyl 1,2-cyclic phosphodiesterase
MTPVSVRFWGTRGSIATPGPATERYGGNTPCTEIMVGAERLIIDAGTGIRELGNSLLAKSAGKPIEAHLLIGHTHWDHIQGLPFFIPAYLPSSRIHVYGVHGTTQPFKQVLEGQMAPAYFPIGMGEMAAKIDVNELTGPFRIGEASLSYHYLNHPGITIGFRIETPRGVVCYVSDHEPYAKLSSKNAFTTRDDSAVADFVAGADLLICEAQYTDEEYAKKKSWGHSTFADVLALARRARARRLALFHHDPSHTDAMMDRLVGLCRQEAAQGSQPIDCFAAKEGMELTL